MRGMPYKQASRSADGQGYLSPEVQEALAKQAAQRAPKSPPKIMSVTPMLPRMAKGRRKKRPS